MIKKIEYIKNLAVFKDFSWDKAFAQDVNSLFKSINILYGRNYSGKTTLSRIIRAMETGIISDKYENPQFSVEFGDGLKISENNLSDNNETIRVFNEDFVKDNLSFLSNSEGDIESFAVIGENNNKLEKEIAEIQKELGTNQDGEEKTGLYKEQEQKKADYNKSKDDHQSAVTKLDTQLSQKATGRDGDSIKYQSETYGDQNYTISKLQADIRKVLDNTYTPLTNDEKNAKLILLKETAKDNIPEMPTIECVFSSFIVQTKDLLVKQIGKSEKIEELIDNILNKWAKEGKQFHEERNLRTCAFCGSPITQSRWDKLEKHFDEESTNFEKEIDVLIDRIETAYKTIEQKLVINKQNFYSKFDSQIEELIEKINQTKEKADEACKSLISQLKSKQDNLFDVIPFVEVADFSKDIVSIKGTYEKLRNESNSYTTQLRKYQDEAKEALRLREVYDFATTIKYTDVKRDIDNKEKDYNEKNISLAELNKAIRDKEQLIEAKKSLMNDEEKGATKVNEYLTDFFGHKYLSLKAIKKNDTDNHHFKFEVVRDNKKAYHLSEGECSLIAFCYFVAKLDDIATQDKKPIIWIDDPISSLDSNHIFFVYSLINGKIVQNSMYNQLFISTHNLDFLKYLKRLPGANNDDKKNEERKKFRFYIINRTDSTSTIELMPQYMKDYITEFNYLFKQIYLCSTVTEITDKNYTIYYNFGNNARKFLEIFLYYRYPDNTEEKDKLINFFGNNIISQILTNRLNNEYSHLCATFERGANITEVPEMNKVAKLIIETIKQKDEEQYNALVRSISMENEQ